VAQKFHFAILRIEVTRASRGLSAIAELLVRIDQSVNCQPNAFHKRSTVLRLQRRQRSFHRRETDVGIDRTKLVEKLFLPLTDLSCTSRNRDINASSIFYRIFLYFSARKIACTVTHTYSDTDSIALNRLILS